MNRVARKEMKAKSRFRLSTEVRATLQRKHDKWTPYRALSRVSKEIQAFQSMCLLILSFFKGKADDDEGSSDDVACDGRSIRMFSDMIRSSLRDEDFISGKFFFIFYYIMLPFSFTFVCHVQRRIMIMFFCLFVCRRLCIGFGINFWRRFETCCIW